MKKINLAITGGLGRMGQQIINSTKKDKKFKIISITENKISNKKISGFKLQINSENAFKNAQVIIDFSTPKCTLEILKIASVLKKKVVIGTTGFSNKDEKLIKNSESDAPKLEKVIGNNKSAEAKIAGITPAVLIFKGK